MKAIAYIKQTPIFDTEQKCNEVLSSTECANVHFEGWDSTDHLVWKQFVKNLDSGDTAVFVSLSNAFNCYRDFVFFVKHCDTKKIAIRSIDDNIDSLSGTTGNLMKAITMLPIQTYNIDYLESDYQADQKINGAKVKRAKRHQLVVNMYSAGYSIKLIIEKSRYSKTSIYRILHKYNVPLEYPSMSHKKEKEART